MAPLGLLPAAGRGARFGSAAYLKELFPLLFAAGADGTIELRPLCELALRAIRGAGAERCLVLVSPERTDALRVLASGRPLGMSLAYAVQEEPLGLPHAVRCALPWLLDQDVVFAMPDTVVFPEDALSRVNARRRETGAAVTLGLFSVEEPERFGPVEIAPDGAVVRILDKPADRSIKTVWGVASWSGAFSRFCAEWDEGQERQGAGERVLGHAFDAARRAGLIVNALVLEDGIFLDIGTPQGLRATLQRLAEGGVLDKVQAALGLDRPA